MGYIGVYWGILGHSYLEGIAGKEQNTTSTERTIPRIRGWDDYSDGSLLLDMISNLSWVSPCCVPSSAIESLIWLSSQELQVHTKGSYSGDTGHLSPLAGPSSPSSNGCWINVKGRVGGGVQAFSWPACSGHTGRSFSSCTNERWERRRRRKMSE